MWLENPSFSYTERVAQAAPRSASSVFLLLVGRAWVAAVSSRSTSACLTSGLEDGVSRPCQRRSAMVAARASLRDIPVRRTGSGPLCESHISWLESIEQLRRRDVDREGPSWDSVCGRSRVGSRRQPRRWIWHPVPGCRSARHGDGLPCRVRTEPLEPPVSLGVSGRVDAFSCYRGSGKPFGHNSLRFRRAPAAPALSRHRLRAQLGSTSDGSCCESRYCRMAEAAHRVSDLVSPTVDLSPR